MIGTLELNFCLSLLFFTLAGERGCRMWAVHPAGRPAGGLGWAVAARRCLAHPAVSRSGREGWPVVGFLAGWVAGWLAGRLTGTGHGLWWCHPRSVPRVMWCLPDADAPVPLHAVVFWPLCTVQSRSPLFTRIVTLVHTRPSCSPVLAAGRRRR